MNDDCIEQVDILISKNQVLQILYHVASYNCHLYYHVLLIIRSEKLLLFHVFTFIPEKRSRLPAFTSFHSIYMQNLPKYFCSCEVIHKNVKVFHHE